MAFEDDLLALERQVLQDAAGDFLAAVAELRTMLAKGAPGINAKLVGLAIPELEAAAKGGVAAAYAAGGEWAAGSVEAAGTGDGAKARAAITTPPTHLTEPLDGLDALLADAKKRALTLLRSGASTEVALAPIFGAATTARSRVVTQINASSNAASETVGEAVKSPMVWEAERDACVHCLALSGTVVRRAGEAFPVVSYGEVPAAFGAISSPPRHPHCRCRIAPLASQAYADALKREAQRSVLRGFSLQSESQAVRVKAAAKLLDRDPIAPKTVKQYAAQAVKAGKFPVRDVPAGDPRLVITGPGNGRAKAAAPSPRTPPPKAPDVVVAAPASPTVLRTAAEAKAWGEKMPDSLSLAPHAKETLTLYSGRGAYEVNRGLRQGTLRPSAKPIAAGLDDLMKKSAVHEDVVVMRALDADAFGGVEGLKKLVGGIFSDKGFLSTSLSDKPLGTLSAKQVRMSITVPKGTPAIYVGKASQFKAERELLLDRGTRLAIESATYNARSGSWDVKATVVPKPGR